MGVGGAEGDDNVLPSASPRAGRGAGLPDVAGAAGDQDGGASELVGEVGRVRSAVRAGALGRVQAVVALEAARSVAWAGLLRQVAALVDEMGASGGPAAPMADDDGHSTGGRARGTVGVAERSAGADPASMPASMPGSGRDAGLAFEAAAAELAVALVVPLRRAQDLVAEALAVTTRLPVTLAALEAGRIDPQRSRLVAEETIALSPAHAATVDAALAGDLGPLTVPALRARVRHLVATTDPEAVRRRVRRATCARGIRLFPVEDGMAQLVATGPVLDLACVFERLTTTARARAGEHGRVDPHAATTAGLDPLALSDGGAGLPDRRGIDARRFDALVDLATTTDLPAGAGAGADPAAAATTSTPRARSPHGPQVTVALTSLLGRDDDPAQHPTLGPVPAVAVAELLAAGHRFRRALTAPLTGHLVGLDGHLLTLDPTTATPLPGPPGKGPGTTPARRSRREAITVRVETPDDPTSLPTSSPSPTDPAAAAAAPAAAAGTTAAPAAAAGRTAATAAAPAAGRAAAPAAAAGTTAATAAAPAAGRAAVRAAATAAELASSPSSPSPPRPQTSPSSTSRHTSLRHAARRSACSYAAATGGPGPYTPTDACARWVRTRSPRCQAPGCRMPATRCDLDHRTSHATGGPTCPCNLDVLCRRHHLAKHHFGWVAALTSDDPIDPGLTWTTPLGQTVEVPAQPLLPRPAPRATDDDTWGQMLADDAAAAALEDHLLGGPHYPHHDSAAHDLDRVHAELARQHAEARTQRDDTEPEAGGGAGGDRSGDDATGATGGAGGWDEGSLPPY
ncbi:HNH endonuclease signature motif containing protein [uncultured Pseudokineococcus sp.]|uniref:HNH endonuclease signature motif containing protein n=1 Tax=uncultured Pseudokineococcus sp. TaxID=1642928 RepID=UPI002621F982|nr:HNH endonuclease signature motif containing protein [uncultured Pseudokineococcus sp.]